MCYVAGYVIEKLYDLYYSNYCIIFVCCHLILILFYYGVISSTWYFDVSVIMQCMVEFLYILATVLWVFCDMCTIITQIYSKNFINTDWFCEQKASVHQLTEMASILSADYKFLNIISWNHYFLVHVYIWNFFLPPPAIWQQSF
jgi:hypothetical protein